MRKCSIVEFLLFCMICLAACDGSGLIELETDDGSNQVVMVDTITVETSTVYAGPIPTSTDSIHLTGGYNDEKLGKIRARSYFQIAPEGPSFAKDKDVLFDSLVLIIKCNGYYYGDTTRYQTLSVHRLREEIEAEELPANPENVPTSYLISGNPLLNTDHFEYDTAFLATVRIRPRPTRKDSLHIRLPDELGQEWVRLSENGDELITNTSDFLDYFQGIVLAGDPEDDAALIGYHTQSTMLRLYYREQQSSGIYRDAYTDFPLVNHSLKFNEIIADRSDTPLQGLNENNKEVPSVQSDEETFLQAGTGLMTGISLPYIGNFIDVAEKNIDVSRGGTISIHSAQLLIEPVAGTHNGQTYLPESLTLYTSSSKHNIPQSPLNVTSSRQYDNEFPDRARFAFNITDYFSELVKNPDQYQDIKLLLSLPSPAVLRGVTRLCVGSQEHRRNKLQLIVYYTPNY